MNEKIRAIFKKHSLPRKLVLLTDLTIMALGFLLADVLRFNLNIGMISLGEVMLHLTCILLPVYLLAFLLTGSYRGILRHSSIEDFLKLFLAISLATVLVMLISGITHLDVVPEIWMLPYSVVLIHSVVTLVLLLAFRLGVRGVYQTYGNSRSEYSPVLIFGAGELGQIACNVLENDGHSHIRVAGFIDDKKVLEGKELSGKQIYTEKQAFKKFIITDEIKEIILAIEKKKISPERKKRFLEHCVQYGVKVREVPLVKDWIGGKFSSRQIRDINIEDLLGREPIWLNQDEVSEGLKNAVVLVTGAAGSIGSEIVRQLMSFESKKVILLDLAESPLFELQSELLKSWPASRFEVVIASVIDRHRMRAVFDAYRPEYVFHAAAYKHVPLMEDSPYQAIRVNVGGTTLVADLSVEFGAKKFVMISTDKAVNPTNVMGASKRICEIYIQSLAQSGMTDTQFITTRFGNVLGSNGSVVPVFRRQIAEGGPVTVTHPEIMRYFMTIPEACQLVLEAGFMGNGGEIYVFDMGDPVKIYDLAVKMITLAGLKPDIDIPIVFTGLRPGEKLYEELLADEENTIKTHHPKIKAAQVREHRFTLVKLEVDELLKATQAETDAGLVQRMKKLVPEYISNNSEYCKFDEVTTA
ncbi:MAG: polysaccharide biosynthesis protein [Mangrovibacterium sp.]